MAREVFERARGYYERYQLPTGGFPYRIWLGNPSKTYGAYDKLPEVISRTAGALGALSLLGLEGSAMFDKAKAVVATNVAAVPRFEEFAWFNHLTGALAFSRLKDRTLWQAYWPSWESPLNSNPCVGGERRYFYHNYIIHGVFDKLYIVC